MLSRDTRGNYGSELRCRWALVCAILFIAFGTQAHAQDQSSCADMDMRGGGMMRLMQQMHPKDFIQQIERHAASGTSAEPNSTPMPMIMTMKGNWMLMFHANAFLVDTQQTSPRGGDKFFSTNWFMPMVERGTGAGATDAAHHVQPGAGDCYGSRRTIPLALSAGRDGLRCTDRRRAASP